MSELNTRLSDVLADTLNTLSPGMGASSKSLRFEEMLARLHNLLSSGPDVSRLTSSIPDMLAGIYNAGVGGTSATRKNMSVPALLAGIANAYSDNPDVSRLTTKLSRLWFLSLSNPSTGGGGSATAPGSVDSVNGSDSAAGTPAAPWQTLGKAQTALTAGQTLTAVTGSTWREQFTDQVDMSVAVSGSGAIPVIDGADVVGVTWTQPDNVTYPNVWSISWTRTDANPSGVSNLGLWADGVRPRYAASLADLQTNGGWYASALIAATATVYVKSVANPNSSGVVYEISRRNHCFYSYDSTKTVSIVGPLEMKRGVAHYGALSMGFGTVQKVLLRDCGIHHMVTQGSSTTDCVATEYDPAVTNGISFTAYRNTGAGFSHTFTRCLALNPGGAARITNPGFYCHSGTTNPDSLTLTGCIIRGMEGVNSASVTTIITGLYSEDPYGYGTGGGLGSTVTRSVVKETGGASPKSGGSVGFSTAGSFTHSFTDCAAAMPAGVPMAFSSGSTTTITNCSLYGQAFGLSGAGAETATYNILRGDAQAAASSTYTGDHNVFIGTTLGFKATYNSTIYFSLATWQTATGQDAHSCYADGADQVSGNPVAFWKGLSDGVNNGPADGDFRINAGARVYSGAGTQYIGTFPDGTSLQLAGAQTFYHHTNRTSASGPPTGWLTLPTTIAQMRTYIQDPTAWVFYAPPTISGSPALALTTGVSYVFTPTITATRWPATVSLAAGTLPAGITLNSTTGALSGAPTLAGASSGIVLRITDADGRTASLASFTLTVTDPPPIVERDVIGPFGTYLLKAVTDRQESSPSSVYFNEQES